MKEVIAMLLAAIELAALIWLGFHTPSHGGGWTGWRSTQTAGCRPNELLFSGKCYQETLP